MKRIDKARYYRIKLNGEFLYHREISSGVLEKHIMFKYHFGKHRKSALKLQGLPRFLTWLFTEYNMYKEALKNKTSINGQLPIDLSQIELDLSYVNGNCFSLKISEAFDVKKLFSLFDQISELNTHGSFLNTYDPRFSATITEIFSYIATNKNLADHQTLFLFRNDEFNPETYKSKKDLIVFLNQIGIDYKNLKNDKFQWTTMCLKTPEDTKFIFLSGLTNTKNSQIVDLRKYSKISSILKETVDLKNLQFE